MRRCDVNLQGKLHGDLQRTQPNHPILNRRVAGDSAWWALGRPAPPGRPRKLAPRSRVRVAHTPAWDDLVVVGLPHPWTVAVMATMPSHMHPRRLLKRRRRQRLLGRANSRRPAHYRETRAVLFGRLSKTPSQAARQAMVVAACQQRHCAGPVALRGRAARVQSSSPSARVRPQQTSSSPGVPV